MKNFLALIFVIALAACTNQSDKYSPANQDPKELDANLWAMIRYLGKAPEGLTIPERFYPGYDSHYVEQMKIHTIDAWYEKGDVNYFLVSKRAPSMTEKRVATGGKIVFDENGKIKEYEEVFRTWKMVPDTLKMRAMFLFDKMVTSEPLQRYETKNSKGVEYIEFPDDVTYFDKIERTWKMK